ncbi:unnamed protein product [Enterobius vermicularis]|uniref:Peptidase n=1 Tax=Enterobius vermicularis TaxID=51028 RepID=A0A0N4VKU9_ENTVE|nr:unnamed protein product [Enterobius vermicularis]
MSCTKPTTAHQLSVTTDNRSTICPRSKSANNLVAVPRQPQANRSALLLSGESYSSEIQQEIAERFIRKAKAQGCTVTIADGCLYIDYNFVGYMPQYKP